MLDELHVAELGVIDDLRLVLGPGMTAVTGETGAGKTLVVEAIELLLGGRADPVLVRPGAGEALVEGRFRGPGGEERTLARAVPADGRSRAYLDGRMASSSALAEAGRELVDLHGQHSQQSLLAPAAQRAGLDAACGIDTAEVAAARRRVREIAAALADLGGDVHSRARELDLVGFQLDEIDRAGVDDPGEEDALRAEEEVLADAAALRRAAFAAHDALTGEDGVVDRLGRLVAELAGRRPLAGLGERLRAAEAELADVASEARAAGEAFDEDPARLAAIGERRQLLRELRRKYGDTLGEVIAYREELRRRAASLASHDARAAALEEERAAAEAALAAAEDRLGAARRSAARGFATAVERRLQALAMPRARFAIDVGPGRAGEDVTWLLGANPGEPALPLAKVASGGELARAMLAVRLVLAEGRDGGGDGRTLVFDEVDAGIGGEAAVAVGQALATLAARHQVLVVTHLPQVAAFADHHVVVRKDVAGDRTVAAAAAVTGPARVEELSRMLSGRPDSRTARRHAEELLAGAHPRGIPGGGKGSR